MKNILYLMRHLMRHGQTYANAQIEVEPERRFLFEQGIFYYNSIN